MHLSRLSVRGYKNLTREIVLDGLGAVHVLHGENNVGKSNVLESLSLLFHLLSSTIDPRGTLPLGRWCDLAPETFATTTGLELADVFNL